MDDQRSGVDYFAQVGFLRELLWNNIESAKDIWVLKERLGIHITPNTAMAISLDNYYTETRNKSEAQKSNLRRKTCEEARAALKSLGGLAVQMEENFFAIVLESEDGGERQVKATLDVGHRLRQRISDALGLNISVGIGRRYSDVQHLHLSYREAVRALSHRYFLGIGQVIHIDQILPPEEHVGFVPSRVESDLVLKVLSCDREGAFGIMDEFLVSVGRMGFLNPVQFKSRVLELFAHTVKTVLEAGADDRAIASVYGRCTEAVLLSNTLPETIQQSREFLTAVIDCVRRGRERMNVQAFQEAIKYIRENFRKPLKLRQVARHVYVSDCHFSHGFKKFLGMSFEEYLTGLRMNEAKKLLLTTEMRVKEVAAAVGYRDPNYFGRAFRAEVGVPPSRFKPPRAPGFERDYCEG